MFMVFVLKKSQSLNVTRVTQYNYYSHSQLLLLVTWEILENRVRLE